MIVRRKQLTVTAFLFVWVFVLSAGVRGDLIVLQDGREYDGRLVRATAEQVVFRQNGEERRYERSEVVHVRLQKERRWDDVQQVSEIPDSALQKAVAHTVDPRAYPGAGTLTLLSATRVRLLGPQHWQRTEREITRVLNEHGENASVRSILYRVDAERVEILHGLSVRPEGTVLHLRDTAVQDESVYADQPRYDRLKRRRFALPEGKAGIVLDSATRLHRDRALPLEWFYDEFLFGGMDPGVTLEVHILVPEGCPFRWTVLNDRDSRVSHSTETTADGTWHHWIRTDSPQLLPEPMMPPLADIVPRLVVSTQPGSWAEIADGYRERLQALEESFPGLPAADATGVDTLWETVSRQVRGVGRPVRPLPLRCSDAPDRH